MCHALFWILAINMHVNKTETAPVHMELRLGRGAGSEEDA